MLSNKMQANSTSTTMKLKTLQRSHTFSSRTTNTNFTNNITSTSNNKITEEQEEEDDHDDMQVRIPRTNLGEGGPTGRHNKSQPSLRRVSPETVVFDEAPSSSASIKSSSASSSGSSLSLVNVERVLPNGDLYTGTFLGSVPHGLGKYLWSDGCMYEGDWRKGKASGKGRFSWPSGATYEGEFKVGRMEGFGTFIGTDGDTYRGMWLGDKKHGHGEKLYANGDVYEGDWKNNVQDGEGKYVWRNGNVYVGDWRGGVISGKGVLIWANGNRYEGSWENGTPKGAGVYTRPDGSTYAGNWGNGNNDMEKDNDQLGVAVPASKGRMSVSERGVNFPRICIWEADEDAGDITCDIIDKVEASKLYRDASRDSSHDFSVGGKKSPKQSLSRCQSPRPGQTLNMNSPRPYWYGTGGDEVKKPGQLITKGHKNYELMLNLQLGIRHSVGKHASKSRGLKASDFEPREKYWTRFAPEGSKHTPPHQSSDFKWKDYCPMVFRHLRDLFRIDPAEYMLAICGSDALREFSSPGKSGCCFYLTQDDRYMIKTVRKAEVKVLIKMLPKYYDHVSKYKNTLVTKFFGVHCVKPVGGQKTRFIVMGNLFHSDYRIHKRFDLKGSSHGRSIDKPEGEIDETTTLKDLDLKYVFRLQSSWFEELISQVDRDCEFLEAEKIMDYSLLMGLHFRDDCPTNERGLSPTGRDVSHQRYEMFESENHGTDLIMEGERPFIRLGANMPARAERVTRIDFDSQHGNGTPRSVNGFSNGTGEVLEVILYFGIIDILQDYDISKKLEHAYKSLQVDSTSISAVDPKLYSKRFRDFMHRVFMEDE